MGKIVVLGNSIAGMTAIRRIRATDTDSPITLITSQGPRPYRRDLFADYAAGRKALQDIYGLSEEDWQGLRVDCLGKKVVRINFAKNRVHTEDRQTIDYDILLLADTEMNRFPEIRGAGKAGVFGLRKLSDVRTLVEGLMLTETVVIQSGTLAGLKMACALQQRKKEVIWVTPGKQLLSSLGDEETAEVLRQLLEEAGIRVIVENPISEILGNGDVKAIRLTSGKVIASQSVIFADAKADLKLFRDSGLDMQDGVVVNAVFQSNHANVYALDSLNAVPSGLYGGAEESLARAEQQGEIIAAHIQGREFSPVPPLTQGDLVLDQHIVNMIGCVEGRDGVRCVGRPDPEGRGQRKIFISGDRLVGGILIDCPEERDTIARFVTQQLPVSEIEGGPGEGDADLGSVAGTSLSSKTPSPEAT